MSQAQATSRDPRGWSKLIDQIHAAEDRQAFLRGMLDLQCAIVGARYGAIWLTDAHQNLHLACLWPAELAADGPESAPIKMMREAATSGFQRGVSHMFEIEIDQPDQEPIPDARVYVTVLRAAGRPAAVCTAVGLTREAPTDQPASALREIAAGLFEGYDTKQEARQHREDAQRVRRALALLAVSQGGRGFAGAVLNLVNELAVQHRCARVSLGWVRGRAVRVIAISDTEHIKRHSELVSATELAMAECLDQQQPIVCPVPPDAEPLLAQAVIHAHRKLIGDRPGHHALSVPLRNGEEWVGVLTFERADLPFDPGLIQQLQLVADVVAPHLASRRRSDRWLVVHTWHSLEWLLSYLVGPKHVAWKLAGVVVAAGLIYAAFGTWPYRVTSPFVLEAEEKRIVSAPIEGRLDHVSVEPGVTVSAGDVLAQLDTTDLRLQLAEAQGQLKVTTLERAQAIAEGARAKAQQAEAQVEQLSAHIKLLQYRLDRATIRSPVAGVVLSGYWRDKIGTTIEQGDTLFEVAPLYNLVALVHVDEADIDLIDNPLGRTGELATRSEPEKAFAFQVERVVPMAFPLDGVNGFELRCRLEKPADWLRPGMQGLAKVEVGRRPIRWIASHRLIDTLRLWLWW